MSTIGYYTTPACGRETSRDRDLGYGLFILLTAVLFLKPQLVFPSFNVLHVYRLLTVTCAAVAYRAVLDQLSWRSLRLNPVTFCVVGLQIAISLSHLHYGSFQGAFFMGLDFIDVCLFYLLLVSLVDTPARFDGFLKWLTGIMLATVVVSMLYFYGVVGVGSTLVAQENQRLQIYNGLADPNSMAVIMTGGVIMSLHFATRRQSLARRCGWIAALLVFLYAIMMTQSRGGFITLLIAAGAYSATRIGLFKSLLLAATSLPFLIPRLGRMGTIVEAFEEGGTGISRLFLWEYCLINLHESPLFGIGAGEFRNAFTYVAHNSYLESYAELGFLGGSLFLGAVLLGAGNVWTATPGEQPDGNTLLSDLRPCMIGMLAGNAFGLITLSLQYRVTTYLVLGLAAVYCRLVPTRSATGTVLQRMPTLTVIAVGGLYLLANYMLFKWVEPTAFWIPS